VLPDLLFVAQWSVHIKQAFRQFHFEAFLQCIEAHQILRRKRNLVLFLTVVYQQEWCGAAALLNVRYDADLPLVNIDKRAADEVGHVKSFRSQFGTLGSGDLNHPAAYIFGIADRINAGKLQHDASFVKPMIFEFTVATRAAGLRGEPKLLPFGKLFWKVGEEIGQDLTMSALRPHDAGNDDEILFGRQEIPKRVRQQRRTNRPQPVPSGCWLRPEGLPR